MTQNKKKKEPRGKKPAFVYETQVDDTGCCQHYLVWSLIVNDHGGGGDVDPKWPQFRGNSKEESSRACWFKADFIILIGIFPRTGPSCLRSLRGRKRPSIADVERPLYNGLAPY